MPASIVNVVFSRAGANSQRDVEVYVGEGAQFENIATPTSTTQSTNTADEGDVARVTPVGGAVYALSGSNPTVAVGSGWYIPDGVSFDVSVNQGDKIAVIDA